MAASRLAIFTGDRPSLESQPAPRRTICSCGTPSDLGYRRWEWKCNNRNEPSKRAAERFGFKSEGVFRQHMIVKGENRDTAWYSIIDTEWPALKRAYEEWLDPANFDNAGQQRIRLGEIRAAL